ncbi:cell division protein FtsL [Alkanindiges sp. WGS2144]|uniref:cell division protein FtsL n=1 Tax=Alkanindiges sp. WGS2144 TaxID=3366808 RepID=UPI0037507EFA
MAGKRLVQNIALKHWLLPGLLVVVLVGSAMSVVHQVFLYREEFKQLQKVRSQREKLDVEWSRLLIEQQTFGATPQIGGRAVISLRMYSPPPSQTVVLATPSS